MKRDIGEIEDIEDISEITSITTNQVNQAKKYKVGDIILVDDNYCLNCDFRTNKEIFLRYIVETKCPFCDEKIIDWLGFKEHFEHKTANNNIYMTQLFLHLRKEHKDEFIEIKNIKGDYEKELIKFTLVKKVVL